VRLPVCSIKKEIPMAKTGVKKIAMVTGAGRGLGRATAELLALEGKSIVAADVDGDSAENVAEALSRHTDTQAVTVDVSSGWLKPPSPDSVG
jgi:NAD(P)-dependent dehydrogenase (short-subunit alcohol dehydrogenase family)